MERILTELNDRIHQFSDRPGLEKVGVVTEIGDGVAKLEGLTDVRLDEMLDFGDGVVGLALSLEETTVGAILLGNGNTIREGQQVRATGSLLQVPAGRALLGRVVDALGRPLDGRGPIQTTEHHPIERPAPGIIQRRSVNKPMQTGIMAVDAMIPVGRGQRELIIGDRATGKTAIALDTIINQARLNRAAEVSADAEHRPVYSIYVAIGQRQSQVANIAKVLEDAAALKYTVIVAATAAEAASMQYLAPFSGTAIGEWFMDHGQDALIVYDDLSKHAVAYRQISLLLRQPSGREAFPGDIFYLHSRLLERSACMSEAFGGGSLTSLPVVETQAGDVSAYIPTNIISITDGQIYLETDLFHQGIRPALSIGISVSRVGSAAQIKAMKQVAGRIKLELAQFRELQGFSQFGSDLDAKTLAQLERGKRIVEIFKQNQCAPVPVEEQVCVLWAVQNGLFDETPVKQVRATQQRFRQYLQARRREFLATLAREGAMSDALMAQLQEAARDFRSYNG
jgi:F-type H+-transporting ATPase subunit alpha